MTPVATPAVHENERSFPGALHLVMNRNAIGGEGDTALRVHGGTSMWMQVSDGSN
jgi:hypothetical protein